MANTLINMYDASGNKITPTAGVNKTFNVTPGEAGDWTTDGNFFYRDFTVEGMTADMNGIFGLAMNADDAAVKAAGDCQIRVTAQFNPDQGETNGKVRVRVKKIPTVTIPCTILEFGRELM